MTKLILLGIVAPVVVCAAVMPAARRRWAGAAALGLAFVPAFAAVERWPGLPPQVTWHWIAWLVPLATVAGVADALARWPAAVRLLGASALAAVCGRLLVGEWVNHAWPWRGAAAAIIAMLLVALDGAAGRRAGAAVPLSMCIAAAGASVVLLASGGAKLAQLAGALAACLGVAVALAWWRPAVTLARGGVAVVAVLIPGLLLCGYFASFSAVPAWAYLLAAVAPAFAWPAALLPLERLRAWQAAALRVAVVALPVAIAVAVAVLVLIRREADSAYPY